MLARVLGVWKRLGVVIEGMGGLVELFWACVLGVWKRLGVVVKGMGGGLAKRFWPVY